MKILSIESSCDETSAAVVEKTGNVITVLSNSTATSLSLHAKTGGIIPENAAREQVKWIIPVVVHALTQSENIDIHSINADVYKTAAEKIKKDIDAIAITYGPGLIGSLFIGVETAKTLSVVLNKPLVPVNHLLAHIFANFINEKNKEPQYPFIGLIVSGGHTDIVLFKSISDYTWLGGTRDDAAGEALDKIGRILGLSYPAGPEIEERAQKVKTTSIHFTSPLLHEDSYDFSFSGLKSEVLRFTQKHKTLSDTLKNEICFATQKAIFDVLINKTLTAAQRHNCKSVLLGGGVSANKTLRNNFENHIKKENMSISLFAPEKKYCTDNAAMIGSYALMDYKPLPWNTIKATPELYFS